MNAGGVCMYGYGCWAPLRVAKKWRAMFGVLTAVALLAGCDEVRSRSDSGGDQDDAEGDSGDTTDVSTCLGVGGSRAVGRGCTRNDDCESGVCSIFRDAPRNDDAVCLETPPDCATHVMGTVLDFETRQPMPTVPVVVAPALEAVDDPLEAEPLLVFETDAAGRIDGITDGPLNVPLAVLALSATDGYALTATGIAQPPLPGGTRYEVGTGIHDIWLVPMDLVDSWSGALSEDEDIPSGMLPLGRGAVVGLVRNRSGNPLAGAEVYSEDPDSRAIIRYLADDGTMTTGPTSSSGMFVVLGSETPEAFVAIRNGEEVGRASSGRLPGTMFVMILQDL